MYTHRNNQVHRFWCFQAKIVLYLDLFYNQSPTLSASIQFKNIQTYNSDAFLIYCMTCIKKNRSTNLIYQLTIDHLRSQKNHWQAKRQITCWANFSSIVIPTICMSFIQTGLQRQKIFSEIHRFSLPFEYSVKNCTFQNYSSLLHTTKKFAGNFLTNRCNCIIVKHYIKNFFYNISWV